MNVSLLNDPSLLLIFASVPAGFGHLRVMRALAHGLPKNISYHELGSQDETVSKIHWFTSVHPLARKIYEWGQHGMQEDLFTRAYRTYLHHINKITYEQIVTLIDEHQQRPKAVLVICTHFALAHEIETLKERLYHERGVQMLLVVQVTDDSPQRLWFVAQADLIVSPSDTTQASLFNYGRKFTEPMPTMRVLPYPVSPLLSERLSEAELRNKKIQVDPRKGSDTHLSVPISGAAVGLSFFHVYLQQLLQDNRRFHAHVVSRDTDYTKQFLNYYDSHSCVTQYTSTIDKEVVAAYEEVYQKRIISLEITKPSEQAFKALLSPSRRGGSLLLLTEPVGRQEYDNINFLIRHGLLPTIHEQKLLWQLAAQRESLQNSVGKRLQEKMRSWRAVRLPLEGRAAARFTNWCLKQGVFAEMMLCHVHAHAEDTHAHELAANGVEQFWHEVVQLVEKKALLKPSPL